MRQIRNRKTGAPVRFPLIKDKAPQASSLTASKGLRLERIGAKKNHLVLDIANINKIEKEFTNMTRRLNDTNEEHKGHNPSRDEMRESRLLLLKDKTPAPKNKSNNQNLLSNLVLYHPPDESSKKKRLVKIPQSNISVSPTKQKKRPKQQQATEHSPLQYTRQNIKQFERLDFVKMFIVEELLYYIYRTTERNKEQMSGFCKFYNDNTDEDVQIIVSSVFTRSKDYLESVFYEKLGFYIFLILGTDTELQEQASFLLRSLMGYLHTNNLIILDMLMEIVDIEKFPIASQFHVHNTSRFNEDRRKINKGDRLGLLSKNNKSAIDIIKSILINCGFDSLKTFVSEILANEEVQLLDKIREISMMLVSLDSILVNSIHQTETNKPKPPFLPQRQKSTPYTLVLDMDETLIHYSENNKGPALLIRPYCHQFLSQMSKYYELVIFTAAVKDYADSILDTIDVEGTISHRLYRQHTRLEDYVSIKDLSLINRDLSKSIIIDNIASNFKMQPRNGIAISTWTGDPDDISLLNLIPVLAKLAQSEVKDVRDGLEVLSDYMEQKMKKGQEIDFESVDLSGA